MPPSAPVQSPRTKGNGSRTSNPNSPAILQNTETEPTSTNPIEEVRAFHIWSIFNLLFVPFGILCCYFSHKVNQFKTQNRLELANKWSRRTLVLNIITTLLMGGVILTIVMLRYDIEQRNEALQANQTRTTGAYIPWQPGR